jgi:hypothetical protein
MLASAPADHYRRALAAILRDDEVDSAIAIFIPPLVTEPGAVASAIAEAARGVDGKPVLGAVRDPLFGPLIACGSGGVLVDVLADTAFRLHPLTASDARDMLDELRGSRLLRGYRGAPPAALDQVQRADGAIPACQGIDGAVRPASTATRSRAGQYRIWIIPQPPADNPRSGARTRPFPS